MRWGMLTICLCLLVTLSAPWTGRSAKAQPDGCAQAVTALEEHNQKISADLQRLRREVAALRADVNQPGMREIFGGLGYILGLFGVAAFVASRRKE